MVSLVPGDELYKYTLIQKIGGGSFGEVWLAKDRAVEHQYAVKILRPGTSVVETLTEAKVGHHLQHNNLVRVHNADIVNLHGDEVVLLAMDYLPAGSILTRTNPKNFLPLSETLRVMTDILQGLEYLHALGIYHNDIKPENILIGSADQAMLTDYGIVGVDPAGAPVEAPAAYKLHSAPEVIDRNEINGLTDVFQAGLTMFRLLCGNACLREKRAKLGWATYYDSVKAGSLITKADFPEFIPQKVRRIVLKAVSPEPQDRYQDPLIMRRDIEKLHFPGHWTINARGEFQGLQSDADYRFEKVAGAGGTFSVICFRRLRRSGIERRVGQFCGSGLSERDANRLVSGFMKFVVNGK